LISRYKVNCPKCGKELTKPNKKLENAVFCIALFTCDICGTSIKYATEF
jgi:ribosomal protein S27E